MKYFPVYLHKDTCNVLKLMAALLVITSHIGSVAINHYGAAHPVFYILASQNGYIGVAVFFFLSGFGLMESEQKKHLSFGRYFRRRMLKIYLPVVLVTALWLAFTPPYIFIQSENTLWSMSCCGDLQTR